MARSRRHRRRPPQAACRADAPQFSVRRGVPVSGRGGGARGSATQTTRDGVRATPAHLGFRKKTKKPSHASPPGHDGVPRNSALAPGKSDLHNYLIFNRRSGGRTLSGSALRRKSGCLVGTRWRDRPIWLSNEYLQGMRWVPLSARRSRSILRIHRISHESGQKITQKSPKIRKP